MLWAIVIVCLITTLWIIFLSSRPKTKVVNESAVPACSLCLDRYGDKADKVYALRDGHICESCLRDAGRWSENMDADAFQNDTVQGMCTDILEIDPENANAMAKHLAEQDHSAQ